MRANPPQVFISYSRKDKKWLERLQVFLKPLEREGFVERWDDTRIDPGGKWKDEIRKAIESSFAAVLLISADFLASEFISTNELPPLLLAAKEKGLLILPILVTPCGFARTKGLSEFQAVSLKGDLKPLINMRTGDREALWDRVVETIQKALPPVTSSEDQRLELNQGKSKLDAKFDESLYDFDRQKLRYDARLLEGAILYRMASPMYAGKGDILTGRGSLFSLRQGRLNRVQQRTIYCTNNILLSIAETLYYMYLRVMDALSTNQPTIELQSLIVSDRTLVAFRVHEIADLVNAEAIKARSRYSVPSNSLLVHPSPIISQLQDFGDTLRLENMKGALYPSPRHSRGLCIALFHDETGALRDDFYEGLNIRLRLLAEGQDYREPPKDFRLLTDFIDSARGYYAFSDPSQFDRVRQTGVINPAGAPVSGIVDFVRRSYINYPYDAVRSPHFGTSCPLVLTECPYVKDP
jgi:hypothetical protein